MPEISQREWEKFQELIEKEKQIIQGRTLNREIYLDNLRQKKEALLDLSKGYGPIDAYATVFSKYLKNTFEATKEEKQYFNWSNIQFYLTEQCLTLNNKGEVDLKKQFRDNLRDRGYRCRIYRKYNIICIRKTEPRKVRK
jgi:hypothetical protein